MATRNRGRDRSGHVDPYYQRRVRYEMALRPLGLAEPFAAMPRGIRELCWQRKVPDPELIFDASFPDGPQARRLRKALESAFRYTGIRVENQLVAARDFLTVITALNLWVQLVRGASGLPDSVNRFLNEAGPRLEKCFHDHLTTAFVALISVVDNTLAGHSRLDGRLLTAFLDQQDLGVGKLKTRITVSAHAPQTRRVRIDGEERPAYRVANTWGGAGLKWLSLDARQLGLPGPQEQLPVYVQSHALKRLHERLNLREAAPFLEGWLAECLREPRVIERHGRDLVIEYRLKEYRMGYLVVTPVDGVAVVRTFKFLTMEQTPEARLLERRLRLTRRDVSWLKLDELAAFTRTDLRDDPVLRPLLEECGCGHLFALDGVDYAPEAKGYATEMRRYLRIAA